MGLVLAVPVTTLIAVLVVKATGIKARQARRASRRRVVPAAGAADDAGGSPATARPTVARGDADAPTPAADRRRTAAPRSRCELARRIRAPRAAVPPPAD